MPDQPWRPIPAMATTMPRPWASSTVRNRAEIKLPTPRWRTRSTSRRPCARTRAIPLACSWPRIWISRRSTSSSSRVREMAGEAAYQLSYLMQPLAGWLDDPATEEICINRPGEVFVRQGGVFRRHDLDLALVDLEDIAVLAGALRKQDVGPRNPLCATELPGGERLQICLPPAVPAGTPSLTIRKPGQNVTPLSAIAGRYDAKRWNQWQHRQEARAQDFGELLALYDGGNL